MAERRLLQYVDDIDGSVIDEKDLHRATMSFQGADYELHLSGKNYKKLEAQMSKIFDGAKRTGGRRKQVAVGKAAAASGTPGAQTRAIREWAVKEGYEVSPKGRIPEALVAAYDEAH